jgi:hypothetical protein
MSNIYLEVAEGIVINHLNYPEGEVPKGMVKAPEEYAIGWLYDGSTFTAPADTRTYAEKRAEAYPSLTEQADMAYWDRQNGTTTLDDAISAVKRTYPKPGE